MAYFLGRSPQQILIEIQECEVLGAEMPDSTITLEIRELMPSLIKIRQRLWLLDFVWPE
ncbi:hypothetical protein KL86CLO1_12138 [uncultured Eubacteriales bacterium]|uniref:Uncharacterized protein n=1 Tax=uncultured Eubacteriales bacterium TaxID=172733 RepID=A0A212K3N4_9FIRM|nr:hypothetical protein KL86CLO1_12138 [uncultured Eubacteriales bacterium]